MPKIVLLDAGAVNPGDLSWKPLQDICEVVAYPFTKPNEVAERLLDADYVFVNRVVLSRKVIENAPKLKWIGAFATGYNMIDIKAAKEKGIAVANIPAYSTDSVAQMVFALVLELYLHVGEYNRDIKNGDWGAVGEALMFRYPMFELAGKTMGIIGFGNIGIAVAKIAHAFNMNVLVYSRTVKPEYAGEKLRFASLDEVMAQSDIISVHTPLFDETRGLISKEKIALMKKSAVLINTSRGPVVDENALAEALNNNKIAGAAADVVSKEPIEPGNPLLTAKNCVLTPHNAWASYEARVRLVDIAAENLRSFIAGKGQNIVNL